MPFLVSTLERAFLYSLNFLHIAHCSFAFQGSGQLSPYCMSLPCGESGRCSPNWGYLCMSLFLLSGWYFFLSELSGRLKTLSKHHLWDVLYKYRLEVIMVFCFSSFLRRDKTDSVEEFLIKKGDYLKLTGEIRVFIECGFQNHLKHEDSRVAVYA